MKTKKIVVVSFTVGALLVISDFAFSDLSIFTDLTNAVQTIREIRLTSDGTDSGAKLANLNYDGQGSISFSWNILSPWINSRWSWSRAVAVFSTAIWYEAVAIWERAVSIWLNSTANGDYSTALWVYTTSNGAYSTSMWRSTQANGRYSTAMWRWSLASWHSSLAVWESTIAIWESSVAIWKNNVVDADKIFIIWNWMSDIARSNALTLDYSGNLRVSGSILASRYCDENWANCKSITDMWWAWTWWGFTGWSSSSLRLTWAGNHIYYNSWNVGIWTNTPTKSLDVSGDVIFGWKSLNMRFYIFAWILNPWYAGISLNPNPSLNSYSGGTVYINKDVVWDTKIQSNLTTIASFYRDNRIELLNSTSVWIYSVAMWEYTQANWYASTSMWSWTKANWQYSVAMWYANVASGYGSVSIWNYTFASWIYSTAIWKSTRAIGYASTTMWRDTQATWNHATAMWFGTEALGNSSTAMWDITQANWFAATAMWSATQANWSDSTAMWYNTQANWSFSTAMWVNTRANWQYSTTMWYNTKSNWIYSVAMWQLSEANWESSLAAWHYVIASWNYSAVFGRYNVIDSTKLFIVWNWTSPGVRINVLALDTNWNLSIAWTLSQNSDKKFKKNIKILDNASDIFKLNGYVYNMKSDDSKQMWLIAQEVQKIYPELVSKNSNDELSVNYIWLIAPMLEVIKNQEKRIQALEKKCSN